MRRTVTYKEITWHDDPDPQEKPLRVLQEQYGFHELDIEDVLSMHERPKIEEYPDYLFLVFHVPYLKSGRILKEEVNVFLGSSYVASFHQGKIAALDRLWHSLNESETARKEYMERGTGFLLYEIMYVLFQEGFSMLDEITTHLRRIETALFESEDQVDLLRDILTLHRNIITMRSVLFPQRTLIALLEHKNKKFIPDELELYFDDILDAIERQWSFLETSKEMSEVLEQTHKTWLAHRTNAVMRILTVFSVTLLPLNVVTGIYGMNVGLPLQEHPSMFFLLSTVLCLMMGGSLWYFWRKRWL
ncbi:magnesium transporter CorA family protein [Candidatus Peregrinibacteria bacterium]|nr:magnesium transporter CorA family protein [Candidatus Peregrinibacteria bacterium]